LPKQTEYTYLSGFTSTIPTIHFSVKFPFIVFNVTYYTYWRLYSLGGERTQSYLSKLGLTQLETKIKHISRYSKNVVYTVISLMLLIFSVQPRKS